LAILVDQYKDSQEEIHHQEALETIRSLHKKLNDHQDESTVHDGAFPEKLDDEIEK